MKDNLIDTIKDTLTDTIKVFLAYLSGLSAYMVIESGLKLVALAVPTLYTLWKWHKEYKEKQDEKRDS